MSMMRKRVNRFGEPTKRKVGIFGILRTSIVFVGIIMLFNYGISNLTRANDDEALEAVRSAVVRAAIQFYALEGRFPPHLAYLEDRFGLQIDHERFHVVYSAFAANVMPQIMVSRRDF